MDIFKNIKRKFSGVFSPQLWRRECYGWFRCVSLVLPIRVVFYQTLAPEKKSQSVAFLSFCYVTFSEGGVLPSVQSGGPSSPTFITISVLDGYNTELVLFLHFSHYFLTPDVCLFVCHIENFNPCIKANSLKTQQQLEQIAIERSASNS